LFVHFRLTEPRIWKIGFKLEAGNIFNATPKLADFGGIEQSKSENHINHLTIYVFILDGFLVGKVNGS
jgi:hypothetical protein